MKTFMIPAALAIVLAGCDDASTPLAYTPEMASFSNEFDFDPLRGPVKDFSQTLMNDKGQVTRRVSGVLSEEGCFDQLESHDLENNTEISLVLDANYYLDAVTREKRVGLQGKCQLASLPTAGVMWETDDNGFITTARSKDAQVSYRYDDEGYPLGKSILSKDDKLSVEATPSKNKRKKLDYTAVSLLNDKPLSNVAQHCEYDSHDNPLSCELNVVDDSVTPPVTRNYTIKNTISYY